MALGDLGALALEVGLPIAGGLYGGPAGMGLGGLVGGRLGGALRDYTRQPDQYDQARGNLLNQLQQPYQFDFNPIAQAETQRFNQQTVPSLAERFSGLDAQRSSAFRQSLGQAGSDLGSRLAALQAQTGLQSQGLNQSRMSQLAGLLGQQQQLGQQNQQFGQQQYNNQLNNAMQGYFNQGAQNLQQGQLGLNQQLGYGNLLNQAAAMQGGQGLDVLRLLQGGAATGLGRTQENMYQARQPGFVEQFGGPLAQALAQIYGLKVGGAQG